MPRAAWGMTLAHAGLGVLVAGITGTALWTQERIQAMAPGDSVADGGADSLLLGEAPVDSEDVALAVVVAVQLPVTVPLPLADGGREAVLERDGVEP